MANNKATQKLPNLCTGCAKRTKTDWCGPCGRQHDEAVAKLAQSLKPVRGQVPVFATPKQSPAAQPKPQAELPAKNFFQRVRVVTDRHWHEHLRARIADGAGTVLAQAAAEELKSTSKFAFPQLFNVNNQPEA